MNSSLYHFTLKSRMRWYCLAFLGVLLVLPTFIRSQLIFFPEKPNDCLSKIPLRETPVVKKKGRAIWQFSAVEALPFCFDRYVRNVDFAQISFQSVGHNLNPKSWSWDDDEFATNQVAHPYHGSMYFSAFRANGYSFWQSVPAAFAGSYLWETFAENQYPSPNDFINTSFGGIILGEMTYRLSNKIVNNRRIGFRRQAEEVLALMINPMNGLNRILDKKWGKVSSNTKERDSSKVMAEFDIGQRKFNSGMNIPPRFGWYGHIKLLYGTPFENYRKPFSNISINTEFGKDDTSLLNVVSVYGSLAGWEIRSNNKFQHYAILSANYDYIHNEAFFYSGQSVKINLLSAMGLTRKLKINTAFGAGIVILAAVPDPYKFYPLSTKNRPYDYGSGASYSGSGGLSIAERFYFGAGYNGAFIKTINGNPSYYFLHVVTADLRYMFIKNISACVEPGYFNLHGNYQEHPNVNRSYPYIRASFRYSYQFNR